MKIVTPHQPPWRTHYHYWPTTTNNKGSSWRRNKCLILFPSYSYRLHGKWIFLDLNCLATVGACGNYWMHSCVCVCECVLLDFYMSFVTYDIVKEIQCASGEQKNKKECTYTSTIVLSGLSRKDMQFLLEKEFISF